MKLDYDELSPITGNKCVLVESLDAANGIYSKLCLESGYYSTTYMHPSNEALEKIETSMPDLIRDSKVVDEFGFRWYLSTLNLGVVILYPSPIEFDGKTSDIYPVNFQWVVCPISLKENSTTEFQYDIHLSHKYPCTEFELAFDKVNELLNQHLSLDEEE